MYHFGNRQDVHNVRRQKEPGHHQAGGATNFQRYTERAGGRPNIYSQVSGNFDTFHFVLRLWARTSRIIIRNQLIM